MIKARFALAILVSAAATALQNVPGEEAIRALVAATGDGYLLLRVRAAASLAGYQNIPLTEPNKKKVEAANKEYLASILSRSDRWFSLPVESISHIFSDNQNREG